MRAPGGLARRLALLLLAATLVVLVDAAYRRRSGPLSVQSQRNLAFVVEAQRGSLSQALREHPKVRPPLYALTLWGFRRLGLPARRANELLLLALFALVFVAARPLRAELHPLLPTALFAALHFNYTNAYQCTAEALFTPLGLALLLLLARDRPAFLASAAVAAALGVTRSFALFSLLPLGALHWLLREGRALRRGAWRALSWLALGLLPALAWMTYVWSATGYLSGANRFAARELPPEVAYWQGLAGFGPTLALWARTLFLDFFALDSYGALSVVTHPYRPRPVEWLLAGLALGTLALALAALRDELRQWRTPASLCAQFFLVYNAATILLWSWGNNDPLYSRFLYPSYVFLVLLYAHGFAAIARRGGPRWRRWPFLGLAVALLLVHGLRHYVSPVLPYR